MCSCYTTYLVGIVTQYLDCQLNPFVVILNVGKNEYQVTLEDVYLMECCMVEYFPG